AGVVGLDVPGVAAAVGELVDEEAGEAGAEPAGADCAGFDGDSVGRHAVTARAAEMTTAAATAFLTPPPARPSRRNPLEIPVPVPVVRRSPFMPLPSFMPFMPFMPSPEVSGRRGRSPSPYCSAAQTEGAAHEVRPVVDL
ncbi:hypothetical protein PYK79_56865, partial [Streptomyces sp. ID05-04B]|nr:hypothetical protein [Streptomyces sp. ID05-04B]